MVSVNHVSVPSLNRASSRGGVGHGVVLLIPMILPGLAAKRFPHVWAKPGLRPAATPVRRNFIGQKKYLSALPILRTYVITRNL
jgi:hypothetical protein